MHWETSCLKRTGKLTAVRQHETKGSFFRDPTNQPNILSGYVLRCSETRIFSSLICHSWSMCPSLRSFQSVHTEVTKRTPALLYPCCSRYNQINACRLCCADMHYNSPVNHRCYWRGDLNRACAVGFSPGKVWSCVTAADQWWQRDDGELGYIRHV